MYFYGQEDFFLKSSPLDLWAYIYMLSYVNFGLTILVALTGVLFQYLNDLK